MRTRNRFSLAVFVILFAALISILIFWLANAGSRPGPEYEVSSGGGSPPTPTPYFSYDTIGDEGSAETQRRNLNFVGPYVSCADNAPDTDCTWITPTPQPTPTPGAGGGTTLFAQRFTGSTPLQTHYFAGCVSGCISSVATTNSIFQDRITAVPIFIANNGATAENLRVAVSNAGSASENARIGIYQDNGNLYPEALVIDGGTFVIDSTGLKTISIASTGLTQNTWYWLAVVSESSTVLFSALQNTYEHIFANTLGTQNDQFNRANWGVAADHTCGSGCSNSLPDPFPTTNQDILNNVNDGDMLAITVEVN